MCQLKEGNSRAPYSKEKKQSIKRQNTVAGTVVGGIAGSIFGPAGTFIGAGIGAAIVVEEAGNVFFENLYPDPVWPDLQISFIN